jgi:hypothetical protein
MPKEPRSQKWLEPSNQSIICPHCQRGHAEIVRRFPDPTRAGTELRTYSCSRCHHQTVLPVKVSGRAQSSQQAS